MIIKCVNNTGRFLRNYEIKELKQEEFGRFGTSEYSEFGQLELGKEYLAMGIIVFETYLSYIIDDNGFVSACPCQLFESIDSDIPSIWHFRLVNKDEEIFPHVQGIFGYPELCHDKDSYFKLIIDREEQATRIYFKRKAEVESK